MNRKILLLLALSLCMLACTRQTSSAPLETPLALFYELKFEDALPLFEEAVARYPRDAEAHTWLAETCRRLGRMEAAESAAWTALAIDSCHSFAHYVLASILLPSPYLSVVPDTLPNWRHLMQAVACDSTNGDAWMMIMVASIWRGKEAMVERSQRWLGESGFLTSAALAFGRWLLRTLPQNAILFTNGDMDTYPTMSLQASENFRPDVTVIEREWLNFPFGRRWYREHAGLTFPAGEKQLASTSEPALEILHGWAAQVQRGTFSRPVAFAVTVQKSFYSTLEDRIQYAGPFYLLHPQPVARSNDLNGLKLSLSEVQPEDFTGPWISDRDTSPVRRKYTRYLAANVTGAALVYVEELLEAGRNEEAGTWLKWAEEFEKSTRLGPYHTEQINTLRGLLATP